MSSVALLEFLKENDISFERYDHEPVFTCEEARRLIPELPGAELKNLFLSDEKGRRFFLVVVSPEKRIDLKKLGQSLQVSGLRFGSPERLKQVLDLDPGSVTILGVFNDREDKKVELLIDRDLWHEVALQCHPLVNTATLVITREHLLRFLDLTEHKPQVIEIPERT